MTFRALRGVPNTHTVVESTAFSITAQFPDGFPFSLLDFILTNEAGCFIINFVLFPASRSEITSFETKG
jgi:hypothetical protein